MKKRIKDSLVEEIYTYLISNCKGKANAVNSSDLAVRFGIAKRVVRYALQTINTSSEYKQLISTTGSIYACATDEECRATLRDTYSKAISLFKKANSMRKKVALNGQGYFDLNELIVNFIDTKGVENVQQ